ncbi:MAG TPA: S41 family peptidase, partial [Gemmatimonadales bacterium]|nr:S41 family peptidase [Gemmatimonadales bacterium]
GLILSAVDVAALLFPRATVVFRTAGRRADADRVYTTRQDGAWRALPLIVLVDDRSASAAEALAGSLQDHDRALIVGRRSFGKALMQQPFFLQTGDVVMLTTGHVFTPNGRYIQRRYTKLEIEQYYGYRGTPGAAEDTAQLFHTDAGRPVHGGGGIAPDLEVPASRLPPAWFVAASDSGYEAAVADSVAQTLPATPAARAAWLTDSAGWGARLLPPFLGRVRATFHIPARMDDAQMARITAILAARVAEVRWGPDAAAAFRLRNDADVQAALAAFPRLPVLLAPARP